jgi:hypothetical protein
LFGISNQSTISDTINSTLKALLSEFVPKFLGFSHIDRDTALWEHNNDMFHKLFAVDPDVLFLILDGTYVYIEKPAQFDLQKVTWSEQKKRNLLKPFMVVLPDGYILAAEGPFGANGTFLL